MEDNKPYLVFRKEGSEGPFQQVYCNGVPFDVRTCDGGIGDESTRRRIIREVKFSLQRQRNEIREVSEGELADLLGNESPDTDSSENCPPKDYPYPAPY